MALTESELATVERGQPVAKILDVKEKREVAAFGIVRVQTPRPFFVERFRDIEQFKRSAAVLQIGRFSDPPRSEDVRDLIIDPVDIDSMRTCRVGDCDVRLSRATIERFRREIHWSSPRWRDEVTALARESLVEYAAAYLVAGDQALASYDDHKRPVVVADEFRSILDASHHVARTAPEFLDYLRAFPRQPLPGVESFLYWSKEKFGFKPVVSVTHVAIYTGRPAVTLVVSKQIYASHYFDASFATTALIDASDGGFYLMYLNRTRAASLNKLGGLAKPFAERRAREGMVQYLRAVKERLERDHRAAESRQ